MGRHITRRDFLNGLSIGVAGSAVIGPKHALAEAVKSASVTSSEVYPPTLTGIRGSHKGAFETAHALAWLGEKPSEYTDLNEEYDLVVVGAGISGLAAAYFFQQQAGLNARILVLDNHDDFGGHARRNEFHSQGRMLLGAGGSGFIQDAHLYSEQSLQLVEELGFDLNELRKKVDPAWPHGGGSQRVGMYTDRAHFGKDMITNGEWSGAWYGMGNYRELVEALPLKGSEQELLIRLIEGRVSLKKQVPANDIDGFLKGTSYKTFLTEYVGLQDLSCTLWNPYIVLTWGVGADSVSIYEAIKTGGPGLSVLGEDAMAIFADMAEGMDSVWLPDGNASLARQMVRRLIPAVAPGDTVEDLITARFNYDKLDRPDHPVRLRLNSTVTNAVNNADGSVSVSYVHHGRAFRVKTNHCIMACYNGLIPHLCPELPQTQKENLRYGVKIPLVFASVLLRNGRAFYAAGSQNYRCPTSYFLQVTKAPPVTIGNYKPSSDPDSPLLLYLMGSPIDKNNGNQTARDLYRLGRHKLYTTSFEDYEKTIREQLTGMFGATGFDADRDIEAITINRWSHGYAYEYIRLFDPEWPEGEAPHELGRKQFGQISIANSDSEAYAYANAAIDAAWRAVNEQLAAG